jgi:hypothetical protein
MKYSFLFLLFSFSVSIVFSQSTGVGVGTVNPHPSAELDVSSTSRGFLPPRMTTAQRNSIQNPASGLQIYNTTTDCLEIFSKGRWQQVFCGTEDTTNIPDSQSVADIDGNTYPIAKICDQTWMAKNLDVSRYRNGDIIPQVTDPTQWANLTTGAWCWLNNDSTTYKNSGYGKLYNYYAVRDPRGLAPEGWHIPTDGEWNKLIKCIDANADTLSTEWQNTNAGGAMKVSGNLYWLSPNTGATNTSNFSALPSGYRASNGSFESSDNKSASWWWTSTENWLRHINNIYSSVYRSTRDIKYGFSVRCVKDTPITTLENGLVAYYPFNGNANDESGNGNNAVVMSGTSLAVNKSGNSASCYYFDGYDGLNKGIMLPIVMTGGEYSANLWFQINDTIKPGQNSSQTIFLVNPFGVLGVGFNHPYAPGKMMSCVGDALDWRICSPGNPNSWNLTNKLNWHNLSIIKTISDYKYYLDGQLIRIQSIQPNYSVSIDKIYIGASQISSGEVLRGKIDEVRIYNRALTQAEITYLATH